MSRIIVVAESDFQIIFNSNKPVEAIPGGTLLNVAIQLNRFGNHVVVPVSEVGNDYVGKLMTDTIASEGLPTDYIDHSADIQTSATLVFINGDKRVTERYTRADEQTEGLDVIWPRINPDDTVLFGGYMAVNPRMRKNLWQLLEHCAERGVNLVYFPGFDPTRVPRITKVMPMILENLEIAKAVVCRAEDLQYIFEEPTPEKAYLNRLAFYGVDLLTLSADGKSALLMSEDRKTEIKINDAESVHQALARMLELLVIK